MAYFLKIAGFMNEYAPFSYAVVFLVSMFVIMGSMAFYSKWSLNQSTKRVNNKISGDI